MVPPPHPGQADYHGRKIFDTFGGPPLPDRISIVVTRDKNYQADGTVAVYSIKEALQATGDAEEVMIIGGASFYEQLL